MAFSIEFTDFAYDELNRVKAYHRTRIVDAINRHLMYEPTAQTRNRKELAGVEPRFEHKAPVWELRVGEYRVYYDVSDETATVLVRAVRFNPPHASTEEIL